MAELATIKGTRAVSVVLPALDEESTVGGVVEAIIPLTRGQSPDGRALVDEIVVIDGGSTDDTAGRARAAGARVVTREQALPRVEVRPGKGEVLWRSLAATRGDVIVFVDADLVDVHPWTVIGLLGPVLTVPGVELVKGFYRRPLRLETLAADSGGGRVTELVARPLIAHYVPDLSGIVQPLGGEFAATRALLESVPFASGYGVEIALLLDTHATRGLDAIAQVDLGVRKHRNRSLVDLGVMGQEILETVLRRLATPPVASDDRAVELVQFVQVDGQWTPRVRTMRLQDRPPMAALRGDDGALPIRAQANRAQANRGRPTRQ